MTENLNRIMKRMEDPDVIAASAICTKAIKEHLRLCPLRYEVKKELVNPGKGYTKKITEEALCGEERDAGTIVKCNPDNCLYMQEFELTLKEFNQAILGFGLY